MNGVTELQPGVGWLSVAASAVPPSVGRPDG